MFLTWCKKLVICPRDQDSHVHMFLFWMWKIINCPVNTPTLLLCDCTEQPCGFCFRFYPFLWGLLKYNLCAATLHCIFTMRCKGQYHFKGYDWQVICNSFIALQGEKLICCICSHWRNYLWKPSVKAFLIVRTHNSAFGRTAYSRNNIVRVRM